MSVQLPPHWRVVLSRIAKLEPQSLVQSWITPHRREIPSPCPTTKCCSFRSPLIKIALQIQEMLPRGQWSQALAWTHFLSSPSPPLGETSSVWLRSRQWAECPLPQRMEHILRMIAFLPNNRYNPSLSNEREYGLLPIQSWEPPIRWRSNGRKMCQPLEPCRRWKTHWDTWRSRRIESLFDTKFPKWGC